jgi:hypothetical protein
MGGQGVHRREVLRILGTAAAAAHFPGFSKWGFACGHIGNASLQIKPADYKTQFFSVSEYAAVERLTDIIIPGDSTPGAKEAGVADSSTSWSPILPRTSIRFAWDSRG